jgi:hypothetical protein
LRLIYSFCYSQCSICIQVTANKLVDMTGHSFRSPFLASALVLTVAGAVISSTWTENHGAVHNRNDNDSLQLARLHAAARTVLKGMPTSLLDSSRAYLECRSNLAHAGYDPDII